MTFKHVVSQLKVPVYGLERTMDVPLESMADLADFYAKVSLLIYTYSKMPKIFQLF